MNIGKTFKDNRWIIAYSNGSMTEAEKHDWVWITSLRRLNMAFHHKRYNFRQRKMVMPFEAYPYLPMVPLYRAVLSTTYGEDGDLFSDILNERKKLKRYIPYPYGRIKKECRDE